MSTPHAKHYSEDSASSTDHSAEPADPTPSEANHQARRQTRLAPAKLVDSLSKPFVECGCGECPDSVDPLADAEAHVMAADVCPSPQSVTIERAREIYIRYQRSQRDSNNTSKLERHRGKLYPRILRADQDFRTFDALTTVMVTRRISPLDDSGDWIPPIKINKMLHGGDVKSRMRKAINYQLGDRWKSYVAVTAPTESAATPHEHIYYWIFDPDNEITVEHFEPALEKHLESCPNARREDHQYDEDGMEGAITVRHDPPLTDQTPQKAAAMVEDDFALTADGGTYRPNTRGAQYLASQLAHLPLGDQFSPNGENPRQTLLEGGAIAWASSYDWFRSSQDIPKLEDRKSVV